MAHSDDTYRIPPSEVPQRLPGLAERKPLGPGALAGEYLLKGVLASGGHGAVYEAEHRILGRRAAVKVLHPHLSDHGEMLQRFVREARVVNQIRHPNIVDVFDFGMLPDGSPFYVMELLPGRTLGQMLQERGRLSPERALAFLEPVCAALEAAHKAGVVHRDLKASNVAVVSEGERPEVKLLDFGIAKLIHAEPGQPGLTVAGQRLGTSQAMAPEQFRGGPIGPATDVYALGVMLYQMLTGSYPFQSEDRLEVERMHLEAPPPRLGARVPVSPAVDAVVLRCMEKEAARRYPDVASFVSALREAVAPALPTPGGAPRSTQAFAVHAEVSWLEAAEEEESTWALVSEVLDGLEHQLRSAGFLLAMQTGTALLGVRLLEDEPIPDVRGLVAKVRGLHQHACERVAGAPVRVRACAHVGPLQTRQTPEGPEVVGGPASEVASWRLEGPEDFSLTPAASRALEAVG